MGATGKSRGRPAVHVAPEVAVPEGVKMVLAGVDTVWLTVQGELSDELAAKLDALKEKAQVVGEAVSSRWRFDGEWLLVEPYGAGKGAWRWVVRCPDRLMLDIGLGKHGPICRAQIASAYLWHKGAGAAIGLVDGALRRLFGKDVVISLSEVHLCVDVAGLHPDDLTRAGFLTRARKWGGLAPEEAGNEGVTLPEMQIEGWGRRIVGCQFAPRAAHSCVIYDKLLELRQHSPDKVWFLDLWRAGGWDGKAPITRIEMRYKRDFLREAGLLDHIDVLNRLGDLWRYSTEVWLRYCVPTTDVNRARWPVHPLWVQIQAADFGMLPSCPVVRQNQRRVVLERMVAAVTGYVTSTAAWIGGPLASDGVMFSLVFRWFCDEVATYLEKREQSFTELVVKKRQRFGLVAFNNTAA